MDHRKPSDVDRDVANLLDQRVDVGILSAQTMAQALGLSGERVRSSLQRLLKKGRVREYRGRGWQSTRKDQGGA
jgi:predicted ArsR family transcriptional regulator